VWQPYQARYFNIKIFRACSMKQYGAISQQADLKDNKEMAFIGYLLLDTMPTR
jgi:hypothetical protein